MIEQEKKFLVLTDEWRQYTTFIPMRLSQGNIPQREEQGAKVFIEFDEHSPLIARIRFELGDLIYNIGVLEEPEFGEFEKIRQLKAWNSKTGEIELSGSVVGRLRSKTERTHILTFKDYAQDQEFECFVEPVDARNIFDRYIPNQVQKARDEVSYGGNKWEVDVYEGRKVLFEGKVYDLVTADLENPTTGFEGAAMLPGLGPSVKDCVALRNDVLARTPKDQIIELKL